MGRFLCAFGLLLLVACNDEDGYRYDQSVISADLIEHFLQNYSEIDMDALRSQCCKYAFTTCWHWRYSDGWTKMQMMGGDNRGVYVVMNDQTVQCYYPTIGDIEGECVVDKGDPLISILYAIYPESSVVAWKDNLLLVGYENIQGDQWICPVLLTNDRKRYLGN